MQNSSPQGEDRDSTRVPTAIDRQKAMEAARGRAGSAPAQHGVDQHPGQPAQAPRRAYRRGIVLGVVLVAVIAGLFAWENSAILRQRVDALAGSAAWLPASPVEDNAGAVDVETPVSATPPVLPDQPETELTGPTQQPTGAVTADRAPAAETDARNKLQQALQQEQLGPAVEALAGSDSDTRHRYAAQLLRAVSELVPSLQNDPRLLSLLTEIERPVATAGVRGAEPDNNPVTTTRERTAVEPVAVPETAAAPMAVRSFTDDPEETAAAAGDDTASGDTVPASDATASPPAEPRITVTGVIRGELRNGGFVRRSGGSVFMLQLAYSHFNRGPAGEMVDQLVVRLRPEEMGNLINQEVIPIPGDRGTKSVVIDSLQSAGGDDRYYVDFFLDGELLSSHLLTAD